LEDETARRFGKLPSAAHEFFAVARLRLDCKRRGIVRLDVGPEAVAVTFLPGRLRKSRAKSLERDGDRVVYTNNRDAKAFERINDLLELLDE
jgi:transcription-repair coupling factor (superfamily II helicase)